MKYSDGKDYSHLQPNGHESKHDCPYCGEKDNVTITDEADICHECGEVYT